MAKSALGRGLGQLMNGDKVAGSNAPSTPNPPGAGEELWGRGVQTLLEPRQEPSKPEAEAPSTTQSHRGPEELSIPSWFFFGADLLMLALALVLVLGPRPLPTINVVLALLATVIGCCSGLVGVFCKRPRGRGSDVFRS